MSIRHFFLWEARLFWFFDQIFLKFESWNGFIHLQFNFTPHLPRYFHKMVWQNLFGMIFPTTWSFLIQVKIILRSNFNNLRKTFKFHVVSIEILQLVFHFTFFHGKLLIKYLPCTISKVSTRRNFRFLFSIINSFTAHHIYDIFRIKMPRSYNPSNLRNAVTKNQENDFHIK